jgi:FkbM family methyltransferase
MKFIYALLKLIYQPFKAIANFFGFTIVAVYNKTATKKYDVNIRYNKLDKNIFNNLVETIIDDCKSELDDVRYDTFDLIYNYRNYVDKITETYNLLEDDFSKEVFFNVIKYRLTSSFNNMDPSISPSVIFGFPKYPIPKLKGSPFIQESIKTVYFQSEYEIPKIFEVQPNDIVFDVGAYYGDTALYFNSAVLPNGSVYAFEPNPNIANILRDNISTNNGTNVVVVEKGLSDSTINSKFQEKEGESKVITNEQKDYKIFDKNNSQNTITVQLTTIDEFMVSEKIKKIDLIKMDIEGHERAAIVGATNTIKSHKPKLAIAIYHSAHDLFELALLIHSIRDDYKYFVRHATNEIAETVLFCI